MEMSSDQLSLIAESLRLMVEVKEYEIESVKEKTEADYVMIKRMTEKFRSTPFSVEHEKDKEIQKIRTEIKNIEALTNTMISGEHRILAVPRFIRLKLTIDQSL